MTFMNVKLQGDCCVIAVALAAVLVGCGPAAGPSMPADSNAAAASRPSAKSLTKVDLALNWFPEAEHGGYYAALAHGYFEEEGLDVTILPGGPKVPILQGIARGQILFGVDNADKLLLARAGEADVVALLAPIQQSPRCIMVHEKSALKSLADLSGRKGFQLAINTGQPFAKFLQQQVDLKDLQIIPYPGNVARFLLEPEFGQQAYSFSEPYLARQQGGDPHCLMLSEIGFDVYTSLLITSEKTLLDRPDLVEKMTAASIRGWQKYLADPGDTNRKIHEVNQEMSLEILQFGHEQLVPLCAKEPKPGESWGAMSLERWATLVKQMEESGSLEPGRVQAKVAFRLPPAKTDPR